MEDCRREYDSIQQMIDSMPCELQFKNWLDLWGGGFFVFQSKNNDELQRHLTDPSITITRIATGVTDRSFIFWSRLLIDKGPYLLQIWAPVTIGDKQYLTTSDQPFRMKYLVDGLGSYRKHCLDCLIPIDDDMISEEGHLGPPGRVFQNELPEVCLDVRDYNSIEYPLREKAVACGIYAYFALPLSKSSEYKCGSVLELVFNERKPGLHGYPELTSFEDPEFTVGPRLANFDIYDRLLAICKTHQLLLAQTWVSNPNSSRYKNEAVRCEGGRSSSFLNIGLGTDDDEDYDSLIRFRLASRYIKKGRGVVGKAFSSKGACFCKDITKLSIDEYSLVPSARKAGLTGCFAICLKHHTGWEDYLFIVEFFLPNKKTGSGDPRTSIKMLLATIKEHLKDFRVASGQEVGVNLSVEVIKTSPADGLDSFEICDSEIVLRGGAGTALDNESGTNVPPDTSNLNQLGDAINNAENMSINGGEQNVSMEHQSDTNSNVTPIEAVGSSSGLELLHPASQSSSFSSGLWFHQTIMEIDVKDGGTGIARLKESSEELNQRQVHQIRDMHYRSNVVNVANVVPDASNLSENPEDLQHGGEVVHFGNATSRVENVNNAEQDCVDGKQAYFDNMGEIVQLDDAIDNLQNLTVNGTEQNVVSMEQRDSTSNKEKNQRAKKSINREYRTTRADLLQHSGKKLKGVANHFGVSNPAFKRKCTEHQIFRRSPFEAEHVEQDLNSKPDSTENATIFWNDSSIAVKVTYRDNMIRFNLPVSLGKTALEEEIAKRFRLSLGSFDVKYLDEDGDWISVTCDEDWKTCVSIMKSLGKNTVKMLVNLSLDN